jgi:hypothetical protein
MDPTTSKAVADVITERARQVQDFGWTPNHDDQYSKGELAGAAACYALKDTSYPYRDFNPKPKYAAVVEAREIAEKSMGTLRKTLALMREQEEAVHGPRPPRWFPWDRSWWRPGSRRRNLVKAAALLIAEIELLDRTDGQ